MRRWRKGFFRGLRKPEHHQETRFEPRLVDESVDEILELAWMLDEEGSKSLTELAAGVGETFAAEFENAQAAGMIKSAEDAFELMPNGRERAREIIRRHRLTETLLTQILAMDTSQVESDACRFEHILSPEATESICTLLGHPPVCPHGKPIPQGPCCRKFRKEMTPLVTPLSDLRPGEVSEIVFIAPKSHARLDRLASLGIVPGSKIKLHQKRPTCVIKIGETDVAIDANVAGEIFVKRV